MKENKDDDNNSASGYKSLFLNNRHRQHRKIALFSLGSVFLLTLSLAYFASSAYAFSFSDIFAMFGVSASEAPAHHTVYLVLPLNNSYTSQTNDTLQFVYNHTGSLAGVVNCTLLLDDVVVNYTESVAADTNTVVLSNTTIAEGAHSWWVNCTNGTASESSLDIGGNFTFRKYIRMERVI